VNIYLASIFTILTVLCGVSTFISGISPDYAGVAFLGIFTSFLLPDPEERFPD
jgi:hypothetical protein